MDREEYIEKVCKYCSASMFGIYDLIRDLEITLVKSSNKSKPRLASFYENGIHNKIMCIPTYLSYEYMIWILEYLTTYYVVNKDRDIYVTIDDFYDFDKDVAQIVDEINERLDNKIIKI